MLIIVRAQSSLYQFQVKAKHAVFTEVFHLVQPRIEFDFQFLLGSLAFTLALITIRVETHLKILQQNPGELNMVHQGVGDKSLAIGKANLAHVAGISA